jgi:ceramide glucosyltransferase
MNFAFYFFATILIYFSLRSFLGGINFLGYVRSELAKPASDFTPFVSLIAPCKGYDHGLDENLNTLFEQDYPAYEVIFVIDDASDLAADVIRKLTSRFPNGSKLVVAPRSTGSSQKVENLREAALHVDARSEVLAFVDSDVRTASGWLRALVAPLRNERVGAATGYRWFIADKPSFAAELRSAWNASIASALGPKVSSNFCWGGSMAIRREVFEGLNIREQLQGTVSDDFTITRLIKQAGLDIYFVPQALTPSIENCTFRELLEFTNRQMKITRVYAAHLWALSYFGSALFNLTLIWAFMISLSAPSNSFAFWAATLTIAVVATFSIGKSYLRWKAVKLILVNHSSQISKQFLSQNTLWLFAPAIFLYNCSNATFSRTINWRGNVYEMVSPTETRLLEGPNI